MICATALQASPRLFVPASALVGSADSRFVLRVVDGKARREAVRLGPAMPGGFELVHGPAEGTRVIDHPPEAIADGYPVKERTQP